MKLYQYLRAGIAFVLSVSVLPFGASFVHAEEPEEPVVGEEAELLDADIPNTAAYFPDANFRSYLTKYIDTDGNGILSQTERNSVVSMYPHGLAITDVTGLKYFPNITKLWVDTNKITKLDLSGNTKIKELHVFQTDLPSLDLSMLKDLEVLWCYNCFDMKYLNIRNCTKLKTLWAYRCDFSILDLTDNELLINAYKTGNKTYYTDDGAYGISTLYRVPEVELWIDTSAQVKTKLAEPTSVKINQGDMYLGYAPYMGLPASYGMLTVTIKPDNASERGVTWYSSDSNVVSMTSDGFIAAVGAGTAEIKARVSPTVEDTIKVTVSERPLVHKFVARMYMIALDRAPDVGGFSDWVERLTSKKSSAAEVVRGFFLSAEMANKKLKDDEYVERCYKVMFDRKSDSGGKKDWLERLENGVSRTYVIKGFIDSPEFAATCAKFGVNKGTINVTEARDQNYGITSFTVRCYKYVLDRKFDVSGLNDWCSKILKASSRKQAAIDMASTGFYHSPEYIKKNTSNDEYVTSLYWTFLGRKPDKGGYTDWMNKLSNGTSRDEILHGFAYSPEFAKIMASYGIY